jgi:hypothetical protein
MGRSHSLRSIWRKHEEKMLMNNTNVLSRWVLPGLIAGVVFLGVALLSGTLATATWAMPDAIAQTVGISAPTDYGFAAVPVMVGIAVHLALSIGFGALFTAIASWRRLHGGGLVVAAVIFITLETVS